MAGIVWPAGISVFIVHVLVIGSGAREHALLLALKRDPEVEGVSVAPGNAGTSAVDVVLIGDGG
ncbi:hypothetical protein AB0K45_12310, partial [Micrococcus luteus]